MVGLRQLHAHRADIGRDERNIPVNRRPQPAQHADQTRRSWWRIHTELPQSTPQIWSLTTAPDAHPPVL
jgi:hypothetical protein